MNKNIVVACDTFASLVCDHLVYCSSTSSPWYSLKHLMRFLPPALTIEDGTALEPRTRSSPYFVLLWAKMSKVSCAGTYHLPREVESCKNLFSRVMKVVQS